MRTMQDLKGKSVAVESSALGAFVLSRALALNGMQASDVNVVHLESNEQPSAFEKGQVDGAVTFDPYRAQFLQAGATTLFDSTQIPGEIVDLLAVRASVFEKQPKAIQALLAGWFGAIDYMEREPKDAARRMGIRQQTTRRAVPGGAAGSAYSVPRRESPDARRADTGAGGDRTSTHGVDGGREVAAHRAEDRRRACARTAGGPAEMSAAGPPQGACCSRAAAAAARSRKRGGANDHARSGVAQAHGPAHPAGFAATLSTVNLLYHVPQAERAAEEDSRKRLAQEMSRLQSTLEYLLLKGDMAAAQHEIAVLAHNHDVTLAALTDDQNTVIAATRRAWLGRQIADVLPHFDPDQSGWAIRERRAGMTIESNGNELLGHAGILMGSAREELRPSRTGSVFLAYDLKRYKAEARAQVLQQSLYWAGWVTALALAMWLVFHFLLTRRTARLVLSADQFAAGNLAARSGLKGRDELGRLSRAFDAMALAISTDITERKRSDEALRVSEASYRAIFDAAEDAIFVIDIETAGIVDANPRACAAFGYSREEFRHIDLGTLGSGVHPHNQQGAMELFARAVAGEQLRVEWHSRNKAGGLRWQEVFGKRVTIGGQDRILALARDITDRKMAEEALCASEEQYRSMFNASIDGLALWNAAGEIVDTNPALWRMYGYSPRRVLRIAARQLDGPFVPSRVSAIGRRRRIAAPRTDGAPQGWLRPGARGARSPDAVSRQAPCADHRPGHHRKEALRGRVGATARNAVPTRKTRGARFAAGRCRPRAQQSAFRRRGAGGIARGTW